MKCPFCREDNDRVLDTRASQDGYSIRRRRECLGCKRRYTTYEQIEEQELSGKNPRMNSGRARARRRAGARGRGTRPST